jgi:hypothetical protein
MSFSTFSGPLRSGTQRYGSAAVENCGLITLSRTAYVNASGLTTGGVAVTLFTLPAGSKILNFMTEITTTVSGGGVTNMGIQLGKTGTVAAFAASYNSGVSGRTAQATIDTAMNGTVAATDNIGTLDVPIVGTFTAAGGNPTAGQLAITVIYQQRADNGAQAPAFNQN